MGVKRNKNPLSGPRHPLKRLGRIPGYELPPAELRLSDRRALGRGKQRRSQRKG